MESQRGNGEASRPNGSVPEAGPPLGGRAALHRTERPHFRRWVMRAQPLRLRLGSASSGGAVRPPWALPAPRPCFTSALLSTRGRRVLGRAAGAGVTETLAASGACAAGSVGVRGREESQGKEPG